MPELTTPQGRSWLVGTDDGDMLEVVSREDYDALVDELQRLRDGLADVLETVTLARWTPAERLTAIGDYAKGALGR